VGAFRLALIPLVSPKNPLSQHGHRDYPVLPLLMRPLLWPSWPSVRRLFVDYLEEQLKTMKALKVIEPLSRMLSAYVILFAVTYGEVAFLFFGNSKWFFPQNVSFTLPLTMVFIGAYLFNLGMIIRRLYVYDLNDNLFWGAINRLLLSVGIGIALDLALTAHDGNLHATLIVFFAIPFMLNKVLVGVLRAATSQLGVMLNISAAILSASGLQEVSGINIWKEYRLEEEGIDYNVRTLIDWIDQAIVICRFGDKTDKMRAEGVNISAVELAQEAPENNRPNSTFVPKLAGIPGMEAEILTAQLNSM